MNMPLDVAILIPPNLCIRPYDHVIRFTILIALYLYRGAMIVPAHIATLLSPKLAVFLLGTTKYRGCTNHLDNKVMNLVFVSQSCSELMRLVSPFQWINPSLFVDS